MRIHGIGVDIVEVRRIEEAVDRWGDAFIARIFTAAEHERAGTTRARSMRLAARFAAKEAVMKALGLGWRDMAWREIEITNDPLGKPMVTLRGGARQIAEQQGIAQIHISLSHTHELAFASAVALTQLRDQGSGNREQEIPGARYNHGPDADTDPCSLIPVPAVCYRSRASPHRATSHSPPHSVGW